MKWNEYPEIEPPKSGVYLVTTNDPNDGLNVELTFFEKGGALHDRTGWDLEEVIAWQEVSQPYERPIKIKAYPIYTAPLLREILLIDQKDKKTKTELLTREILGDSNWDYWAECPQIEYHTW